MGAGHILGWVTQLVFSLARLRSIKAVGVFASFCRRVGDINPPLLANDKKSYLHDVTETNKMLRLHSDGYIEYGMR